MTTGSDDMLNKDFISEWVSPSQNLFSEMPEFPSSLDQWTDFSIGDFNLESSAWNTVTDSFTNFMKGNDQNSFWSTNATLYKNIILDTKRHLYAKKVLSEKGVSIQMDLDKLLIKSKEIKQQINKYMKNNQPISALALVLELVQISEDIQDIQIELNNNVTMRRSINDGIAKLSHIISNLAVDVDKASSREKFADLKTVNDKAKVVLNEAKQFLPEEQKKKKKDGFDVVAVIEATTVHVSGKIAKAIAYFQELDRLEIQTNKQKQLKNEVIKLLKQLARCNDDDQARVLSNIIETKMSEIQLLKQQNKTVIERMDGNAFSDALKEKTETVKANVKVINTQLEKLEITVQKTVDQKQTVKTDTYIGNPNLIKQSMTEIKDTLTKIDELIVAYGKNEVKEATRIKEAIDKLRTKLQLAEAIKDELNKQDIKANQLLKRIESQINKLYNLLSKFDPTYISVAA